MRNHYIYSVGYFWFVNLSLVNKEVSQAIVNVSSSLALFFLVLQWHHQYRYSQINIDTLKSIKILSSLHRHMPKRLQSLSFNFSWHRKTFLCKKKKTLNEQCMLTWNEKLLMDFMVRFKGSTWSVVFILLLLLLLFLKTMVEGQSANNHRYESLLYLLCLIPENQFHPCLLSPVIANRNSSS